VRKRKLALLFITNASTTERLQVVVEAPRAPFSLQRAIPATVLLPGEKVTARLLFTPVKKGQARGTLRVRSTDPTHKSVGVRLTGRGT
jgi:hypothetical protein